MTATTESALLRAVLETPRDYLPRLIYADEIQDSNPGYADFIRDNVGNGFAVTTKIVGGRHLLTTWAGAARGSFLQPPQDTWSWFARNIHEGSFTIRGGMVDEIECTAGEWIGGNCGLCRGDGHYRIQTSDGRQLRNAIGGTCKPCHGTGRVEGIARQVCERWPVTTVRLVDRPVNKHGEYRYLIDVAILMELGEDVFIGPYSTREKAEKAQSGYAVNYGRSLAGLPPLV